MNIIMIPGMWCTPKIWSNYSQFFGKRKYNCYPLSLRYHDTPFSNHPPERVGGVGFDDYLDDLENKIASIPSRDDKPPILMGFSMGGLLAAKLASRIPCSALVMLCPATPWGVIGLSLSTIRIFLSYFARWRFWNRAHPITRSEAEFGLLGNIDKEKRDQLYNSLVYESGRAVFQTGLWFLDPKRTSYVERSRLEMPRLVISAENDRIVSPGSGRRVANYLGAEYRLHLKHHHWIVEENGWEKIADDIANWLKEKGVTAQ